jgi:hypothetical protein
VAHADGRAVTVGLEVEPGSGGIAQVLALEKRLKVEGFRVAYARPTSHPGPKATAQERVLLATNPLTERGKTGRAAPVAACLYRGHMRRGEAPRDAANEHSLWWGLEAGLGHRAERDGIRLYAGPWTMTYLDAVEGFPDTGIDEADATVGAWTWLEAHPAAAGIPPKTVETAAAARSADQHPEDRQPPDRGRDRGGRWRP